MYETLFGNKVAKYCLLYIVNYGEGHINGIAKTFGFSPSQGQRQLEKLERDGILISQFSGNTKNYRINPRLIIRAELTACWKRCWRPCQSWKEKSTFAKDGDLAGRAKHC